MVKIEVRYEGALHTSSVHGPSGAKIETDAPVDNQGRGEAFSPTDLVASALANCMLTVMGILAQKHDWPLEGTRAQVEKTMASDPVRRIGGLRVRIQGAPGIPAEARAPLEHAAMTCPVKQSLSPEIELDIAFDWGA